MIRSLRRWLRPEQVVVTVALILMCVLCLLPVVWVLSSSLKGREELYMATPTLLPRHPTLGNYIWMLGEEEMGRLPLNLWNSLKVSIGVAVLQCIVTALAGFAFARLDFRGRDLLFYALIMLMFVPRAGGLMALYELMAFLKLRNSHLGLILLYPSAVSVALFIMRQTFLAVPSELLDAACIDGASTPRLFWDVALPFAKGGLVVVAIFAFIYVWGEYLIALTLLDFPELETISIAVTKIRARYTFVGTTDVHSSYGAESAAYAVAMLPAIIVFVLMQRWFVRGLSEGILKL
jgi:ABC-type glycerol-3-phosphate transport system permease component